MSFKGHKPNEAIQQGMKNAMLNLGTSGDLIEMGYEELKPAFLRPAYQYTSMENDTIARLHEKDYLKRKRGREY